jgi:hypothetical protein
VFRLEPGHCSTEEIRMNVIWVSRRKIKIFDIFLKSVRTFGFSLITLTCPHQNSILSALKEQRKYSDLTKTISSPLSQVNPLHILTNSLCMTRSCTILILFLYYLYIILILILYYSYKMSWPLNF